jgi:hypothetical protein
MSSIKSWSAQLQATTEAYLLSAFAPAEPKYQGAVAIVLDGHGKTVLPQEQVEQWLQVDIDVEEQAQVATDLNNVDIRSTSGFMDLSNEGDVCKACDQEYRCNKRMQDACTHIAIQQAGYEIVEDKILPKINVAFTQEKVSVPLEQLPTQMDTGPVGFNLASSLSTLNALKVQPILVDSNASVVTAFVPDRGATYSGVGSSDNLTKVLVEPAVFKTKDDNFTFTPGDGLTTNNPSKKPNLTLVK